VRTPDYIIVLAKIKFKQNFALQNFVVPA